jgi:hypothetical protein
MTAGAATANPDGSVSGAGAFPGSDMTWEATIRAGESEAFGDTIDYGGMPISFSHSESADGDTYTATIKVGVPAEWTDQAVNSAAVRTASFTAVPAASPAGMKRFLEISYQVYTGADNASSLMSEFFKGPEEALNELVDLPNEINRSCLPDWQKTALNLAVNATALEISFFSAAGQVIPAAVFALGFLVPIPGLNIVADFALGKFLSLATESLNLVNARLTAANVRNALAGAQCPEKPKQPNRPPTADPTYIFDPSGFVYAALASERLAGVTATIQSAPSADGPWTDWDAAEYGQDNPQLTDADGRYGWDVPPGWWRVKFELDGYRTAYSEPLPVLPPQTDVNVGLARVAPPAPTGAAFADGAVEFAFDTWMTVDTVPTAVTLLDADGSPVAGSVSAVDPQDSPAGTALARSFVFTPDAALSSGAHTLVVGVEAQDYAGIGLSSAARLDVAVAADETEPDPDPDTDTDTDDGDSGGPGEGSGPDAEVDPGVEPGGDDPDDGGASPEPGPPADDAGGDLAATGGPYGELTALGGLLVLTGAGFLLIARRRWSA